MEQRVRESVFFRDEFVNSLNALRQEVGVLRDGYNTYNIILYILPVGCTVRDVNNDMYKKSVRRIQDGNFRKISIFIIQDTRSPPRQQLRSRRQPSACDFCLLNVATYQYHYGKRISILSRHFAAARGSALATKLMPLGILDVEKGDIFRKFPEISTYF